MIKFENTEVVGWEAAIRGMRNPMNSWEKSDSGWYYQSVIAGSKLRNQYISVQEEPEGDSHFYIGPNDYDLMMRLRKAGTDHRKFMRMIVVYVDITAPLYWWKEYDTYKVGTVANSCSTMHKLADKEFELADFSHEHLGVHIPAIWNDGEECFQNLMVEQLKDIISCLNIYRAYYIQEKNSELKKQYWWQMIQILPSSYNQKRTVMMNYEVLANIYKSRKNHKLDEWAGTKCTDDLSRYGERQGGFIQWIEDLPLSELITKYAYADACGMTLMTEDGRPLTYCSSISAREGDSEND